MSPVVPKLEEVSGTVTEISSKDVITLFPPTPANIVIFLELVAGGDE
jgi:hypothetical protein